MTRRHVRLGTTTPEDATLLARGFAAIRAELGVPPEFPAEVLAAAAAAAGLDAYAGEREDMREIDFLTIDPPGSMDLDQALHVVRRDGGYRLRYAIADLAAVLAPGGVLDAEARRRVQTLYGPDGRTPLHPPAVSEGSASLLPGQVRPAVVWTMDLDVDGEPQAVDVSRALVQSTRRWTYAEAQAALAAGGRLAGESLALLAELGPLRQARERERGGVSLPIPEQEVEAVEGGYRLSYRVPLPIAGWNAQVSLLTGMVAADLMLHGEVGVLRTLPDPPPGALAALRRTALALGLPWPAEVTYPELMHSLDHRDPAAIALVQESTSLLRGAGYTAFDGTLPEVVHHCAVAAPYAHVTAPLRRLVDRFGLEVCVALCADRDVPDWVRLALPELPALMSRGDGWASAHERAVVDLVEAVVLRHAVGRQFDGVVVDVAPDGRDGVVQLVDPAVRARCRGPLPLGQRVRVRLVDVSVEARAAHFALA